MVAPVLQRRLDQWGTRNYTGYLTRNLACRFSQP